MSIENALKAKRSAALQRKMRFDGVIMRRHQFIEMKVSEGWKVETHNGKRQFVSPNGKGGGGGFYYESDLTKTALDYAESLIQSDERK